MPQIVEPSSAAAGLRVTVLVTRWYAEITARLRDAAVASLTAGGVRDEEITLVEVPGAYELPQAAGWIARAADADAIVALGCVIRGETPHFDYVVAGCTEGLMQVALESGIPVGLGVITAETRAQAEARSGEARSGKGGNKGVEAAEAALQMALTYRALEERRKP